MEHIRLFKKPRLRKPYMVVAWPGMGEVAFKVGSVLVEKLRAEEFGVIRPDKFFHLTGSVVRDGILDVPSLPESAFYYWKHPVSRKQKDPRDLIVFLSNAQPDLALAEEYARSILMVARLFKVSTIISLASMPQPIDHLQQPSVWAAATSDDMREAMRDFNLHLLSEAQISGMNGLFLGLAKREGFKGICLLGEIPLYTIQIENPKAALAVLDVLTSMVGIGIDTDDLIEQSRSMELEINKLMEYFKTGRHGSRPAPIGEDEIERIKKALSQLTRLPASVKDRIEKLFSLSGNDPTRAVELKAELDKWSVYKEYEDRFLDLFRKDKKEQS